MSLKPSGPEGTKSCQDSNSTSAVNTTEPAGPKHSRKRKLSTSDAADNLSKRIHRTSDHFQMTIDPSPGAVVGSLDGFQPELSSKPGIPQGRSEAGSGFFPHSQNLVFHNPTMIDNSKHVYTNERLSKALEWLAKNIMHGAEFDSSARDPPPRCHPGTRTSIIEKAQDWVQNDKRERKLWWLRGPAGVGKSAIVQTLAESQYQARRLGASIFFSRPNGRNNPRQVLPSIAYQFAVRDRAYKSYIADLMTTDPNCLQKSMGEQFRILIVEPFAVMQIRSQSETCVVALDGLDECAGDQTETWSLGLVHPYGRHSDRAQCEIVRLVSDFILQYPLVPLIWIIASRPEPHLKAVFQSDRVRLGFWAEDVPVDSEEAFRDVEKYLHTEFSRIRQDYPDLIPTTPTWPSNAHFLAIAKGSSGLFAFASVIVRFIDDPWIGNPVAQLDCVLSALSRMINSQQQNPLAALDALYTEIISRISPGVLQTTKRLLGSLIFLERSHVNVSDCGFRCICNLLDIKRDVAVSALRNLHSVLRIPEAEEIANDRPRFYHASFQDYLEEPLRSHEYWIDQASFGKELFWGSVRLMKALYYHRPQITPEKQTIFRGITLSWPDEIESQLYECARRALRGILCGRFSTFGVNVQYHKAYIFLTDVELRSMLKNLSIKEMVKSSFRDRQFLKSLLLDDLPLPSKLELGKQQFLTQPALASLHLDERLNASSVIVSVDAVDQAVCVHLGETPIFKRRPDEVTRDQAILDDLLKSVQVAPRVHSMILGGPGSQALICHAEAVGSHFPKAGKSFFVTGL